MTRETKHDGSTVTLSRYRCPACGKSEKLLWTGNDARKQTVNALVDHMRMTEDDRHGRKFSMPEDVDDGSNYVEIRELE